MARRFIPQLSRLTPSTISQPLIFIGLYFCPNGVSMADYLHPFHSKLSPHNLKFIIYENDKQRSASNTSNGFVRPVFTARILMAQEDSQERIIDDSKKAKASF